MAGRYKGLVYSRKKGRYGKTYQALGVKSQRELEQLVNQPGRPVSNRRPALQVAEYLWTTNKAGVTFSPGGSTFLITNYPQGANENCRHTNRTITYKMAVKTWVALDGSMVSRVAKFPIYFWLVYDKNPGDSNPSPSAIFDSLYQDQPGTWTVTRNVCHRFVVKKTWSCMLESNGVDPNAKQGSSYYGPGPCYQWRHVTKFFKRLGVSTEWKNSSTGDVADIKEGALYLVCAPGGGATVRVGGRFRMYFKSVGNQ
ncbi:coat protein [Tobacco yellow dwarf virus-A]|uniref:Capsid protein n=1 Tax=Tobacco yellow dwarf virus-A TaxID=1162558 RepID=H9BAJ3_9GEMI|nr:coat protein [Tobacco yellow dwarf virus-A]AGT45475.1 capsid protein [Tobacco yellow dwarf virus-A]